MPMRFWMPSAASPVKYRGFRHDWIVPELTEANATDKGLIYRSPGGQVVYTAIDKIFPEVRDPFKDDLANPKTIWSVRRYPVIGGRCGRPRIDEYPVLADAIAAVNAEHAASLERFGPVPAAEWPEDRDGGWIVAFRTSDPGRVQGGADRTNRRGTDVDPQA